MPPPQVDHGALGAGDQTHDFIERYFIGREFLAIATQVDVGGKNGLPFLLLNILGQIDEYRSRPAALRDVKGLFDDARECR